jgi:hypothetical protein
MHVSMPALSLPFCLLPTHLAVYLPMRYQVLDYAFPVPLHSLHVWLFAIWPTYSFAPHFVDYLHRFISCNYEKTEAVPMLWLASLFLESG